MKLIRTLLTLAVSLMCANVPGGECTPTRSMFLGTHHKQEVPYKVDVSQGLVINGRVLNTDCQALVKARVKHWQAGKQGKYRDELRAYMTTDERGSFRFETEWPSVPSPHIHFIISAEGYRELVTQWVGKEPLTAIELEFVLQAN